MVKRFAGSRRVLVLIACLAIGLLAGGLAPDAAATWCEEDVCRHIDWQCDHMPMSNSNCDMYPGGGCQSIACI